MLALPRATLHTHTRWSDGSAELIDLVAAAEAAGVETLGISDHLVLHPTLDTVGWAMATDSPTAYAAAVRSLAKGTRLKLRLGLEVDFFPDPGWSERLDRALAGLDIDYLIGSVHFIDAFNIDGRPEDWQPLTQAAIDAIYLRYWQTVALLAADRRFAFIGHLDVPKKFGFRPGLDLGGVIAAALDAIAASGIAIEVNTAGYDRTCGEAYPAPAILAACRERGIPVLVNDDAHRPQDLLRHYDRARDLLAAAGYDQVWTPRLGD